MHGVHNLKPGFTVFGNLLIPGYHFVIAQLRAHKIFASIAAFRSRVVDVSGQFRTGAVCDSRLFELFAAARQN